MIIDFQKQFIVDQQDFPQPAGGYMNNECIIEEDEEDTDGQNTMRKQEEGSENEEEVLMNNNSVEILQNSSRQSQESSQNQRESSRYSKIDSNIDHKRNNEQEESEGEEPVVIKNKFNSNFSLGNKQIYNSNQDREREEKLSSSENDMYYEDQEEQEEPVINKTLVMLQKELHKSLFSPSSMKINESPKVSLMNNIVKKTNIPNIFGMNIRPSSGEVLSPTSEETSRHSIRKEHLSKDNHYQIQDQDFIDN